MNIPYNHIIQLKQLPKHGVPGKPIKDNSNKTIDYSESGNPKDLGQMTTDLAELITTLGKDEFLKSLVDGYYELANATEITRNKFKDFKTDQLNVIKTGAKMQQSISKLIGLQEQLGANIIKTTIESTKLEQRNKELNKTFGISTITAAALGEKYDAVALAFGTGGKQIRKYAQSLNAILPLQAKNIANAIKTEEVTVASKKAAEDFVSATGRTGEYVQSILDATVGDEVISKSAKQSVGTQLLEVQTLFQQNLGLSGEFANNFALFAASAADGAVGASDIAAQLGLGEIAGGELSDQVGVTKTILQEISKLTADVSLQFSQQPKALGLAVLKARALGTDMGKIYDIGKNLLNIESSVNNELEYQLLSGKRLIGQNNESLTQKYREATLSGDANQMAMTLNEIVESQGDTIANNFMARKKLAETLGIGEDKLAAMVQQRELLQDMGPGAEAIITATGEDLAKQVEKFEKLDPTDKRRIAFEKLLESQANTLSTDEKQLYYLEEIATAAIGEQVRLQGTSQTEIIRATQKGFVGDETDELGKGSSRKAKNQLKSSMNLITQVFGDTKEGKMQAQALFGTFAELGTQLSLSNEQISALAKMLPGATSAVEAFKQTLGIPENLNVNSVNMSTTGTISIGSGVAAAEVNHDFISRPGMPIQSFRADDIIVGGTSETLANLAPGANQGSSGVSIDYNRMASAIASAMKNVNIVAPVDIYADSKMNMRSIG